MKGNKKENVSNFQPFDFFCHNSLFASKYTSNNFFEIISLLIQII